MKKAFANLWILGVSMVVCVRGCVIIRIPPGQNAVEVQEERVERFCVEHSTMPKFMAAVEHCYTNLSNSMQLVCNM